MVEHFDAMAGTALLIGEGGDSSDAARHADQATAAVLRLTQNRAVFPALVAASFAAHLCVLAAVIWLEHAPPLQPDLTREIPVELVTAPPASAAPAGSSRDKGMAKTAATARSAERAATSPKSSAPLAVQKPRPAAPTPAQAPQAAAPKPALQQPPQKPSPQQAQKPPPPQTAPPKPLEPAKSAQPQAQKPAPPSPSAQPLRPPPQLAQPLPPPVAPEGTPEGRPHGVMQDGSRAVALPKPTDDGDDVVSYQTLVFGMLELKKEFPEDARRRGAYGTALIYFELNDDGTVKSEKLLQSSGDAALDVESLALVQRAAPFPKPPPGAQKVFAADITFPAPN